MDLQRVSRRRVLKTGGGLAAVAVAGAGVGGARAARAQDATPVASPVGDADGLAGRYVAVRSRSLTGDLPAEEVIATIREGYVPIIRAIPGFVAYLGIVEPGSDRTAFVTVFADKAGADESTVQAGAWLTDNGYAFFTGDPVVVEGPIGVAAGSLLDGSGATTATPAAAATPAATAGIEGAYVALRSRTMKPDTSGAALLDLIQDGFLPLLESVPGFVAYLAVANDETRDQFSVGVYADEAGAAESTRRAADWGTQGAADLVEGDPIVVEGVIALAALADAP